jgi:hypothetical protein
MMLFESVITEEVILRRLDVLASFRVVVLIDDFVCRSVDMAKIEGRAWRTCRVPHYPLEQFAEMPFQDCLFLYAVDQDDIGLPYISLITENKGRYMPVDVYENVPYAKKNVDARQALEEEHATQSAEGFDKFDFGPGDFLNIIQAIELTKGLPGVFVEVGCYNGSSGCAALNYLKRKGVAIDCYFLDVFDGFTYPEAYESADTIWKGSHCTQGYDVVSERLKRYEDDRVTVSIMKSNIISDELPAAIDEIRVANLDVDLYEAVLAGLRRLAPKMVPGGVLIVEDAGHTPGLIGAALALEEFCATPEAAGFMPPIFMGSGQSFLIKMSR